MRIKEGFLLKEVANDYIIVPIDDKFLDFGAVVTLNDTGAFLWKVMTKDFTYESAADSLIKEYDIDYNTALKDVISFSELLKEKDLLELS